MCHDKSGIFQDCLMYNRSLTGHNTFNAQITGYPNPSPHLNCGGGNPPSRTSPFHLWVMPRRPSKLFRTDQLKMTALQKLIDKARDDGVEMMGIAPKNIPGHGIGVLAERDLDVRRACFPWPPSF